MDDLRAAKAAAGDLPVLANTGVTHDNMASVLEVADGVIVGTSLKVEGSTWNAVDPRRARQATEVIAAARQRTGAR
jgi:predicted TIM-barrel enzyme